MKTCKGVLEDCERALQSIQSCVAYDGTICKPNQSDLCLVAIARDTIMEYCRLRDIKPNSVEQSVIREWANGHYIYL